MSSAGRRIADFERVLADRSTDGPATRYFFAGDLHRAEAGYGGKSALAILDDVEHVNAAIAHFDAIRLQHRLDVVDFAILVSQTWHTDHAQTPGAIDGLICEATWHMNSDQQGEGQAWRALGARHGIETVIEGRLRQPALERLVRMF